MKIRADYNATLEDQIRVDVAEAKREINELKASITGLKTSVDNIGKSNGLNNFNKQIKQATEIGRNFKSILGFGTVVAGARKAWSLLKEMTNESIDFVETTNLFNVSMGKGLNGLNQYYEKAVKFQNDLQEKLGVNIAESMNYQALFNSMSKSMGISAKYAYTLSENFTKLGYDLASLYNINPENIMQKLRAGLAGQTKPLRDLGLDITQQSLQPIVDSLGIDRSIKNMSQAEKMILRYIAVLNQAKIAQGDFANTMDSPANQLRIFNAQVVAFKRNMGNLWQGFLGGILPYVNAIMMVINELLKMVAKLFGFEVSEQKVNISANIGADDLASDLGTAGKKAKELKAQLMGFDEINNISLQDNSGSGGSAGGATGTGIDQRLLDAMKEYDNLMDKVKNKATEIRDKILDWLGFTRDVNGNLKWSWNDMNGIAKTLAIITGIVGGIYVIGKITKLVQWIKKLTTILKTGAGATTTFGLGIQTIGKFINGVKGGFSNLTSWISMVVGQYKIFRSQGNGVISSLKLTNSSLKETGQGFLSMIPNTVKVVGGLAGLTSSSVLTYKAMQDLENGSIGTKEAMLKLSGGMAGATASGALLGSTFGPVGTAIGGVTGFIISGISALAGYNSESLKLNKAIQESTDKYSKLTEEVNKSAYSKLAEVENTEKLVTELDTLVDGNGRVKSGYEARVQFILTELNSAYGTEASLVNGTIKKYDEFKNKIYELIDTKKSEIVLNAYEEKYTNALKERANAYINLEKSQKEYLEAKESIEKRISELEEQRIQGEKVKNTTIVNSCDTEIKSLKKLLEEKENNYNSSKELLDNYNQDIYNYETLQTATVTGNKELQKQAIESFTNTVEVNGERITLSGEQQIGMLMQQSEKYVKIIKDKGEKATEEEKNMLNGVLTLLGEKLKEQTTTIETLTPEQISAWEMLASNSEQKYKEYVNNIPEDTRLVLDSITGKVNVTSPEYIEKWRKMASESEEKYNKAMSLIPEDTRNKIQSAVDEINKKQPEMKTAGTDIAGEGIEGARSKTDDRNTGIKSVGNWFVQGFIDSITGRKRSVWDVGWDLVNSALAGGNERQKTGSPAKETIKMGNFYTEGYILGIKKKLSEVKKTAKNLVGTALEELNKTNKNGFKINPQDFMIDTNQFIDYGQISGAISTQSKINVDNSMIERMGQACYNAFVNAMKTQGIKADVRVETDKDGIFKVVQTGAEEYAMQTGENPFPVMA